LAGPTRNTRNEKAVPVLAATTLVVCAASSLLVAQQPHRDPAAVTPYKIHVSDEVLKDLKTRLAQTRLPNEISGSGWEYGTDLAYLKELVAYWKDRFDWRAQERKLNAFDQFITTIDGVDIHFIHQRSKEPNAMPLVLTHGWQGRSSSSRKSSDR